MLRASRLGWNGTPHYRRAGGSTFWFKKLDRESREFLSSIPNKLLGASSVAARSANLVQAC